MRKLFCSFVWLIAYSSCQTSARYSLEEAESVEYEALDSVLLSKGFSLAEIMDSRDCLLFYLSTNECSECLANLIDFNHVVYTTNSMSLPVVLWMTGVDSTLMEYYMNQYEVELSDNTVLCKDPEDIFHEKLRCYYTNALFVVWRNKNVNIVKSKDPVGEWNIEALATLCQ